MKVALFELEPSSLLDRVQNRPDVDGTLRLLKKQRMKARGNAVYIPPLAKPSFHSLDDLQFLLMEKVKEFLGSDQKVFLLLGDSGAGKSTFSRELEYDLWQSYKDKGDLIPLHINLPTIDKPEHDMIAKQLRRAEFSEPQIREMKHYRKFILICDGYDESQQSHNLYMSNELNQPEGWDAQMVISCRSEYLGDDYLHRFQPGDRNKQPDSSLFQEAVISPFSLKQVHAYIHQYVSLHQPLWQIDDYKNALVLIPSLQDLVKNPFLMTLSLEVLPRMVDPGQQLSTARVTRVGLYDHFVEQWLERGKRRLGEKHLSPQVKAVFERLSAEGFTANGIGYMKGLAEAIYKEQDGHPVVEYLQLLDQGTWKDAFFRKEHNQLLLEASPLTRNGNQHRFIHRSLLEYALARAIFDPQDRRNRTTTGLVSDRRRSVDSTYSFELFGKEEESTDILREPDYNSPLVWRIFVNDHSLLQFLEERVQQEPLFKEQLHSYIEHSKKDKKWRTAAANAITILVRAGVKFHGADLRGIRIPGADLSYGAFDSAQLQDADLRKVNLRGIWMHQTDLSRAQMAGVHFGELPFFTENSDVLSCAYSPDGKTFAVGLGNGDVSVYTTSNWERILILNHDSNGGRVARVVYSPQSDQIASCGEKGHAKLWDVETGVCLHLLGDHTEEVVCVAYSPQGDRIASADGTVRIWDVTTGECLQTLLGYDASVLCVTYSPQGDCIASGYMDGIVRLWDVESESFSYILIGHGNMVWSLAYSPKGDQLATASYDSTIRLWDVRTGYCRHVLNGHSAAVSGVAFSPNGDLLASGAGDMTVRVWDVESGTCRQTITGHINGIMAVAYSPKGDQIASGSTDNTVRLRDVSTGGASLFVSSAHNVVVIGSSFSPDGDQIVSGSMDQTLRVWSAETGECRQVMDHGDFIICVAYSPQGNQVASGGNDNTVRLWDLATGACKLTLIGHSDQVRNLAFSPDGITVASASQDGTVRLWDAATGSCRRTLYGLEAKVNDVVYSPNGERIATSGKDGAIRLWNVENGECHQILIGHNGAVRSIAYPPQGNQLASGSDDTTIRLWDMETGESILSLTGHSGGAFDVAYSPKGNLLASTSLDKTVRLWDVASGQCVFKSNFQNIVTCIAWSTRPDENYLVTGCADGSVLKWEVVQEGGEYHMRLCWSVTNGLLTVTDASIQDVRGLSRLNKELLKQRGAVGEPQDLLHETSKKIGIMASVVSELKKSSNRVAQESSNGVVQESSNEAVQESSASTILRRVFGNQSGWRSSIKSVQETER